MAHEPVGFSLGHFFSPLLFHQRLLQSCSSWLCSFLLESWHCQRHVIGFNLPQNPRLFFLVFYVLKKNVESWKECVLSHLWLFVTPLTVARLQYARLLYLWGFPGKNTGVSCHFLLQGIFLTQGLNPCLLHLLHWQADSLPLNHLSSTYYRNFILVNKVFEFKVRNDFHAALGFTGGLPTNTLSPTLKLLLFRDILEMWA